MNISFGPPQRPETRDQTLVRRERFTWRDGKHAARCRFCRVAPAKLRFFIPSSRDANTPASAKADTGVRIICPSPVGSTNRILCAALNLIGTTEARLSFVNRQRIAKVHRQG